MEVSRVVVPLEKTQFGTLHPHDKGRLRERAVIDFVRSKPYMSRIKTQDFIPVLGVKDEAAAWNIINNLVKRKKLVKHNLTARTYAYTVPGEVIITKPAYPTLMTPSTIEEMNRFKEAEKTKAEAGTDDDGQAIDKAGPTTKPDHRVRQLAERYFVESFGDTNLGHFIEWCDRNGY